MITDSLYFKVTKIKKSDSEESIKIELYGIIVDFLLSTDAFKKNTDIKDFLCDSNEVFEKIKPYAYDSRTILIGRVIRIIEKQSKLFNYNLAVDIKNHLELLDHPEKSIKNKSDTNNLKSKRNYTDDVFHRFKRGE